MGRFLDSWKILDKKPLKYPVILYYDAELDQLVPKVEKFLEIGTTEYSARFWRMVYPDAKIFTCDLRPLPISKELDIIHLCGNVVCDPIRITLAKLGPYDLICEDSFHHPNVQITLFKDLWTALRGLYIIEDILSETIKWGRDHRICEPREPTSSLQNWVAHQGGWSLIRPQYQLDPDVYPKLQGPDGETFLYAMRQKPLNFHPQEI